MSDSPINPPSSDDSLSPTLEVAFADFASVGVPTILTLLDAIHSDKSMNLPHEIQTLLFGVIGVYSNSLRINFLQGHSPSVSHQIGVLDVMGDKRVADLITMAMMSTTGEMIERNLGEGNDGTI